MSSSSSPCCTSFPVPDILRSVRPAPLIRDALDPFKLCIVRQYHKCSAGSCLPQCPENERIHVSPDSPWGNTWSVGINDVGTTVHICRDTGAFRGCSGSPVEPCNGCTEEPCRHYKALRGILVGAERVPWKGGEGERKGSKKKRGREKEGESSQESTLEITKAVVLKRLKSHLDTLTEKISEVQRDILRVRCAETKAQESELELFQQLDTILPSVSMKTADSFIQHMAKEATASGGEAPLMIGSGDVQSFITLNFLEGTMPSSFGGFGASLDACEVLIDKFIEYHEGTTGVKIGRI